MLLNCGVGEDSWESLDCLEIQPVHSKGNQSWMFIGSTDAETETPIFCPSDAKNWLIGKDFDAGKDWGQDEKRTTEDETVGWHHQLDGHEFEQAPGFRDGQGSLACCSPWGHKKLDTTEWTELNWGIANGQRRWEELWPIRESIHLHLARSIRRCPRNAERRNAIKISVENSKTDVLNCIVTWMWLLLFQSECKFRAVILLFTVMSENVLIPYIHVVKWNISCHLPGQEMSQPPGIFGSPNVSEGFQKGIQGLWSSRYHHLLHWCWGAQVGSGMLKQPFITSAIPYSKQEIKDVSNQEIRFGPR